MIINNYLDLQPPAHVYIKTYFDHCCICACIFWGPSFINEEVEALKRWWVMGQWPQGQNTGNPEVLVGISPR